MNSECSLLMKKLRSKEIIKYLAPMITEQRYLRFEEAIAKRITGITLVIERLVDPLNCSAILRTAEAFGLLDVHFIAPDQRYLLEKKITIGADRWIAVHEYSSSTECYEFLAKNDFTQWAAVAPFPGKLERKEITAARTTLRELPLPSSLAVWLGNERDGLSDESLLLLENRFTIPMFGLSQSLNLSVSTGIVLENLVNKYIQRPLQSDLNDEERESLLARYILENTEYPTETLLRLMAREGKVLNSD
jgi:tRNA (guanosine-2'-O-)-methyltransferase